MIDPYQSKPCKIIIRCSSHLVIYLNLVLIVYIGEIEMQAEFFKKLESI